MLRVMCILWMLACSFSAYGRPEGIEPVAEGPFHEAYITQVTGTYVLDAIAIQPPKDILERIPANEYPGLTWLPGYWHWDADREDFLWIGGAWRRAPPGHHWVPGLWQQLDEGWVWIRGFWTTRPDEDLHYIALAPPDQPDENPDAAPSRDYFWAPGYFAYDLPSQSYSWVSGAWQEFDCYWVFVPAHYVWRLEGWLFIPAFWDWPLDLRGNVYASVFINPELRSNASYMPWAVLDPWDCVQRLYVYYPNYGCFFHHHWHCYPELWESCGCTPPWWQWQSWWCYNWHQCWGLWWWYCNPGYPQPYWLTQSMASHIHAPWPQILNKWHNVKTPFFVTSHGVVKPSVFLKTLSQITKHGQPIVPVKDIKTLQKDVLKQVVEPKQIFRPLGVQGDKVVLPKPVIDANVVKSEAKIVVPGRIKLTPEEVRILKNPKFDKARIRLQTQRIQKPLIRTDGKERPFVNTQGQGKRFQRPAIRTQGNEKDRGLNEGFNGRTIIKTPPLRVQYQEEEYRNQEEETPQPKIIRRPQGSFRLQDQQEEDQGQGQSGFPSSGRGNMEFHLPQGQNFQQQGGQGQSQGRGKRNR